jgi:hypothetical protein
VRLVEARLKAHVARNWPNCLAIAVRSRGPFVYVDAQGREDSSPEPLCRLRYTGDSESWEFAFFTWSREVYDPSVLEDGDSLGTPEDCFDAAAFHILA